ncbi:MAG TPA: hypothetical protein VJ947_07385, partial [Pseudohaliea sp.]|nr:hypothetical protein [Pseudohaliea sp.]
MPIIATEPALARGDRAPNFLLPANDGLLWVFYERVKGRRNALLLLDMPDRAAERALLADLSEAAGALEEAGLDLFVVRGASLSENQALAQDMAVPGLLLADSWPAMPRPLAGRRAAPPACCSTKISAFCRRSGRRRARGWPAVCWQPL